MKAAIYNPYLNTLGGGERYTIHFAKVLIENGYQVDLEWKDTEIKETLENRFGINLDALNIVKDIKRGDGYDLCFWVSDGSIPILRARNNVLHFQVPFHDVNGRSLINKMKLFRINKIVCNSLFTKGYVDKEYGVNSIVIYPPVDTLSIRPRRKENNILFVGRFSQMLQNKGQDILIKVFIKMCNGGLTGWKLVLVGGVEVGANEFLKKIKDMSAGYPIEIIESPDFKQLKEIYGKAKIFWSASGYGQDLDKRPESVEHFGITVVEAMAAGMVPIVYNAGGHKEIVTDEVNGFLWESIGMLSKKTKLLIDDNILYRKLAIKGMETSKMFGYNKFKFDVEKIL